MLISSIPCGACNNEKHIVALIKPFDLVIQSQVAATPILSDNSWLFI